MACIHELSTVFVDHAGPLLCLVVIAVTFCCCASSIFFDLCCRVQVMTTNEVGMRNVGMTVIIVAITTAVTAKGTTAAGRRLSTMGEATGGAMAVTLSGITATMGAATTTKGIIMSRTTPARRAFGLMRSVAIGSQVIIMVTITLDMVMGVDDMKAPTTGMMEDMITDTVIMGQDVIIIITAM
ncbi:hypothetical protein CPB84DRAFT_214378 [Gymnopilus junonius]|uniref:Uncharacterized protein n=1 Tax=Gymnopilus junonius TaxID=109634 RepID=A0A9P5NCX3_GYMJU|nr:hypothetical protein CPB84DRAFT_214378 [Gymnopilus junonius]